jgi:hypothetical protein
MQGGGVELDELQVGDGDPGPQRHGDAVAGGLERVGGHREQLTGPAGGDQHVAGPDLLIGQGADTDAAAVLHHQVGGEGLLVDGRGGAPHRGYQGALDLHPGGGPAGVDDAGVAVATLPGQLQVAVGLAVEDGAQGDELGDPHGALVDQHPHRVGVAQPGPGGQGVGQVEVGGVGVLGAEDRGHAALGPAGGGLVELALGEHPDPQPVGVGGAHRGRQPRNPRPQDQEVQGLARTCFPLLLLRSGPLGPRLRLRRQLVTST